MYHIKRTRIIQLNSQKNTTSERFHLTVHSYSGKKAVTYSFAKSLRYQTLRKWGGKYYKTCKSAFWISSQKNMKSISLTSIKSKTRPSFLISIHFQIQICTKLSVLPTIYQFIYNWSHLPTNFSIQDPILPDLRIF